MFKNNVQGDSFEHEDDSDDHSVEVVPVYWFNGSSCKYILGSRELMYIFCYTTNTSPVQLCIKLAKSLITAIGFALLNLRLQGTNHKTFATIIRDVVAGKKYLPLKLELHEGFLTIFSVEV